jgi:preprotein translocase subunit SecG
MTNIILLLQVLISISLIVVILLQAKGTGLGRAFGGGGEFYRSKRGIEKILFRITIILAVLFLISSLISVLIK